MPLEPYKQRVINVRLSSDHIGKPGLVSQKGAVSRGVSYGGTCIFW
jgi:hypothetical protein